MELCLKIILIWFFFDKYKLIINAQRSNLETQTSAL